MSATYIKNIEKTDTGMVIARVYDVSTGKRVGLEFFHTYFWRNQERTLKRAHAWTDQWISNCSKYCVPKRLDMTTT